MKRLTLLLAVYVYSTALFSQNITNTLGTSGSFIIKDGSTTFLTLDQLTGHLSLNSGVIFKGADWFIHNYGIGNVFMGINAGNFTMTGIYNTAVGFSSLKSNTTGYNNTGLGFQSIFNNSSGYENTAVGVNSLYSTTTGYQNTALGVQSLFSNLSGYWNTALGLNSLYSNTTGHENTAVGLGSLQSNTTGNYNTSVGHGSLFSNTTGTDNNAVGNYALGFNTTGYENTANGHHALIYNSTGYRNTANGTYALWNNTTGFGNTANGYESLFFNATGNYNTAVGFDALSNANGSANTAIGYNAQVPNSTLNNQVRIGNTDVTYAGVQVAWTITSDKRWKSDIKSSALGLSFISKLNPVSYTRINDEKKRTEYGLIAQEVEEVLKEEGIENTGMLTITDDGMYELRYNDLLAPMVKAIQELKAENDELKVKNEHFQAANEELKATTVELTGRLNNFEQIQNMLVNEIEKLKTNNNEFVKVSLGEK